MASYIEQLIQQLAGLGAVRKTQPGAAANPGALVDAARSAPVDDAPTPWYAARQAAMRSAQGGDVRDWQAAADVIARAAQKTGHGLRDAVLIRQGTRGPGPNAAIEEQEGSGQGQQTFQLGDMKYNVFYTPDGKRHVRAFHVGSGRRRLH